MKLISEDRIEISRKFKDLKSCPTPPENNKIISSTLFGSTHLIMFVSAVACDITKQSLSTEVGLGNLAGQLLSLTSMHTVQLPRTTERLSARYVFDKAYSESASSGFIFIKLLVK